MYLRKGLSIDFLSSQLHEKYLQQFSFLFNSFLFLKTLNKKLKIEGDFAQYEQAIFSSYLTILAFQRYQVSL
jgi:hypothetical protein